jgi:hypothetical protein
MTVKGCQVATNASIHQQAFVVLVEAYYRQFFNTAE